MLADAGAGEPCVSCVVMSLHYSGGVMKGVRGLLGEEPLPKACLIAWRRYTPSHEQGAGRFGVE